MSVVGIVLIDSILIYLFADKEEQQREQYYMHSGNENGSSRNYICGIHEIDEQIKKQGMI